MRALLLLAALAVITAAIALNAQPTRAPSSAQLPPAAATTPTPIPTPAPPRLERVAINRQDRTTPRHRAREARLYDTRPLLSRLPLERRGVRIDLAGLAADDRTTVLAIDPGDRSRPHARRVYARALRATHDAGEAYVLEWAAR